MPRKKRAKYTHGGGVHIGNSIANLEISLRPKAPEIEVTATTGKWSANVAVPLNGNKSTSGSISRQTKSGWKFTVGGSKKGGVIMASRRF